jgi:outer membrane protein assembly factor BamE (lipoprotein component of BamABCDE complex)
MRQTLPAMLIAAVLAAAALSGCGEIKARIGTAVAPHPLESVLKIGQSTARDIRQAMGEPHGVGREFLPFHNHPRTVWSYYFEESQVSLSGVGESRRVFVWVFLDDERYDGYLWVSNVPGDRAAIEPGRK